MSEPAKKIDQQPEGYSPKGKPEIMKLAQAYAQAGDTKKLPGRYRIEPKERIAAYSGARWPFSNVDSAMLQAAGLLYGRTDRHDDTEYSIQNCLTGEAFGLFYAPEAAWSHSLGLAVYDMDCTRLRNPAYAPEEMRGLVQRHVTGGGAAILRRGSDRAYLVFGYRRGGRRLLCCEFQDGNDWKNCAYDFAKPMILKKWESGVTDLLLLEPNGPEAGRGEAYRRVLAEGCRLLMLESPDAGMDLEKISGAGQAIHDEWVRQLEQANAENKEEFYMAPAVFPHFIALYENRLHLWKFLNLCAEMYNSPVLAKAAALCGQLKDLAARAAAQTNEGTWEYDDMPETAGWDQYLLPKGATPNERRGSLLEKLKGCRALEREIVQNIQLFLEGYSPKARPEILKLAEGIGIHRQYEFKRANGGSYIDGVAMLRWGEWKDCTYGGALALIFDAMGVRTSYEQLMGLSGSCYKAILGEDWDPSSEMPQVGVNCEHNAPRALGIRSYSLKNEKKRDANVMKSLDNGFPVLVCGQRGAPEWTVLTGYEKTDGGVKFFGRTYFDYDGAPKAETFTANGYYLANQYPGEYPNGLLRFYDKKRRPLKPRKALKISLETCIKTFEPARGGYKQGYDAYDVFLAGFELDDEEYRAKCGFDQYHIGSLMDARRAAHIYLRESTALLEGKNRARLLRASALYRAMLDNLLSAVPYETTASNYNGSANPPWSAQQRQALGEALEENKRLEKEVRVLVADILRHWRGRK